jgi:hypothetical protein
MPTITQGILTPAQIIVAGTTVAARPFVFTINGAAAPIVSATFAARDIATRRPLIDPIACSVASGTVVRPELAPALTRAWPTDLTRPTVVWDIVVTLSDGRLRNWVRGDFIVRPTQH